MQLQEMVIWKEATKHNWAEMKKFNAKARKDSLHSLLYLGQSFKKNQK